VLTITFIISVSKGAHVKMDGIVQPGQDPRTCGWKDRPVCRHSSQRSISVCVCVTVCVTV